MLRKPSLDSVTREFKSVTTEKNSLASDFYFDTRDYFSVAMFFLKYIIIKFTIINKYHHIVC